MGTPKNDRHGGIDSSEAVVIAILSLFGINLPPAIKCSHKYARTHHGTINLRQIGVALQSYQGANQTLPPATYWSADGHDLDEDLPQEVEMSAAEIRGWAEFCCWTVLALAPFLYWMNGPTVSNDQFVVRTGLVVLSSLGAVGLRIFACRRFRDLFDFADFRSGDFILTKQYCGVTRAGGEPRNIQRRVQRF